MSCDLEKIIVTVHHEALTHGIKLEVRDLLQVIDIREQELKEVIAKGSPLQKNFFGQTVEDELYKTRQIRTHIWKYTTLKTNARQTLQEEAIKAEMRIIDTFINLLDPQLSIPYFLGITVEGKACEECIKIDVPLPERRPPFKLSTEENFKKIFEKIETDAYESFGISPDLAPTFSGQSIN